MDTIFQTVAIVGPGLVGGSLGMALRRQGLAGRVIGIGRRERSLREALDRGAVDEVTLDPARGVREADLTVLATPIGAFERLLPAVAEGMKRGTLLSEVASAKQGVIRTASGALAHRPDVAFIPTHPMAGSERRGASHAAADMFEGSVCIFTPLEGTPDAALDALRRMWEGVGATVRLMDPADHDRLVARISHLPHLAAAALMDMVTPDEAAFAGGGLTDTTRVASGDPKLWRDICEFNAEQIAFALEAYGARMQSIRALLTEGRYDELEEVLRRAKSKRDELLDNRGN
jgi:prephenate dehydrogenase